MAVESVTADRTSVTVSGLKTEDVTYTVRVRNGGRRGTLLLSQKDAQGRTTAPNAVRVEVKPTDPNDYTSRVLTMTGTLRVPAGVGPRLVVTGYSDPAYDLPGEPCGDNSCDDVAPASGPTLSVTSSHAPKLTVTMTPAAIALPARLASPAVSPKVRLDAKLVDSETGRPFTTSDALRVRVGYRYNDHCYPDQNIADLPLGAAGTASRVVTTNPSTGVRSSVE